MSVILGLGVINSKVRRGDHLDCDGTPMCRYCRQTRSRTRVAMYQDRVGSNCPFCMRIREIMVRCKDL